MNKMVLGTSFWKTILSKFSGRLASNAFMLLLGTTVFRGSNLLAGIFVARILGKEVFGMYGVVQSSVLMFAAFGALGLGITSTKFIAECKVVNKERAGRIIGFCSVVALISGTIMALIMYFSSSYFAETILGAPELTAILKISSLLLFFTAWQGAQNGSLVGLEAFRVVALVNILSGIILIALTIWGAYKGGLMGAVWGWVCAMIFQTAGNTFALCKANKVFGINANLCFGLEEVRLFWRFSLPAALGGLMFGPIVWAGNAMLVNSPQGFAEMGRYNAGYQWFAVLLFLPGIVNNALLPFLSERKGCQDFLGVKRAFSLGLKVSFFILGSLSLIIIFLSPFIMILYGGNFENGWIVLSILACAAFVAGLQNLIGNMIAVMDKMWLHFKMNILWALTFLLSSWFFTGIGLGATGLALATLFSYSIRSIWSLVIVRKMFKDMGPYEESEVVVNI